MRRRAAPVARLLLFALAALASCDADPTPSAPGDASADASPSACGAHGAPDLQDPASCRCDAGYAGTTCRFCAPNYVPGPDPGTCIRSTSALGCAAPGSAGCGHGTCDSTLAPPACRCDAGYGGPTCATCAEGYARTFDGTCAPNRCDVAPSGFCGHGTCTAFTSPPTCACDEGHTGARCDACTDGFAWSVAQGACVPTCASGRYPCSQRGSCTDLPTGPTCTCDPGFTADHEMRCIPTAGASCAAPAALDLMAPEVASAFVGGDATLHGSCTFTSSGTHARVFRLVLPSPQRVRVSAAGLFARVSLRARCDAPESELACSAATFNAPIEVDLPAGETFVLVEGLDGAPPTFGLAASVVCPDGARWDGAACAPDPCAHAPCDGEHQHTCLPDLAGGFTCGCDLGYDPHDGGCIPRADASGTRCDDAIPLAPGRHQRLVVAASTFEDPVSSCNTVPGSALFLGFALPVRSRVRFHAVGAGQSLTVSVRRQCEARTSELLCASRAHDFGAPALTGGELAAGTYTLVIDGVPPEESVTLDYDLKPDPCADAAPCPAGELATPSVDWATCECACPDGDARDASGACAPDPCADDPCAAPRSRCVAQAPPADRCQCPLGERLDPGSPTTCAADPDAAAWTVLVYHSYDNNLGSGRSGAPQGLSRVSPEAPVDVVWLTAFPTDVGAIHHAGHGEPLAEVARWDTPDMGDWRTLSAFATWAATRYPARRYALVVVDHGGGFGFSWDQGAGGTYISIPRGDFALAMAPLRRALGRDVDVVDFETCLLATWEVAEATRPFARALLASPETAYWMGGMHLVDPILATPEASLDALGPAVLADSFDDSFVVSWTDLTALPAVTAKLSELADAMRARPELCPLYDADRVDCFPFELGDADLECYAAALADDPSLPEDVRAAGTALAALLAEHVTVRPVGTGGLSIYLPPLALLAGTPADARSLTTLYDGPGAVWTATSTWDELLRTCRGVAP